VDGAVLQAFVLQGGHFTREHNVHWHKHMHPRRARHRTAGVFVGDAMHDVHAASLKNDKKRPKRLLL
jgi:hypothetical protein